MIISISASPTGNAQIVGGTRARDDIVANSLTLNELGKASPLNRRRMDENVPAAAVRTDESIPFELIEPNNETRRQENPRQ